MKTYNIYTDDNLFYLLEKEGDFENLYTSSKKHIKVDPNNQGKPLYRIFNLKDFSDRKVLKLSQISDKNGNPYNQVSWENFVNKETGDGREADLLTQVVQELQDIEQIINDDKCYEHAIYELADLNKITFLPNKILSLSSIVVKGESSYKLINSTDMKPEGYSISIEGVNKEFIKDDVIIENGTAESINTIVVIKECGYEPDIVNI